MLDIAILGGGPAGLTAGLYAARAQLSCSLFEQGFPGGQLATANLVENYPGFVQGIGGAELSEAMRLQAERFGLSIRYESVDRAELTGGTKLLHAAGQSIQARAVILCMGAVPRKLGMPGEDRLRGRGVSYCATCDGAFFRDKRVAVIGGGDTAAEDALFLSGLAREVTLIHRRDALRASGILLSRMRQTGNIRFLLNAVVEEITDKDRPETLRLRDTASGKSSVLETDGVFIAVGSEPGSRILGDQIEMDAGGFVRAGEDCRTSVPLVYAAGDIRTKPLRQIVCAVGDGAVAVQSALEDLRIK